MNSITAATPELVGIKPSRFGLRKKILVLAAVIAIAFSVVTGAKAYWIYNITTWGNNASWYWSGNTCYSTLWSSMDFNNGGSPGWWETRSLHTFGWGTGQPWCYGVASKAWIYRPGGSWLQSSWTIAYNGNEAMAYSPTVIAGGVQVQGEGQYQAYHNGSWSTYFQWGNVMYPYPYY